MDFLASMKTSSTLGSCPKSGYKVLGASEWLLDNIYLIEKEYKGIKMEMPIDYFKGLPSISREPKSLIWCESLTQGTIK